MKKPLLFEVPAGFSFVQLFCICLGVGLDQLSKQYVNRNMHFFDVIHVIPDRISIQLVHNYGAAYGLFQNQRIFLLLVSAVVIAASFLCFRYLVRSAWTSWGLSFLLMGAIGNVIDRLLLGYVIDFIDIRLFPVFNVADVCINIAVALFIIEMIVLRDEDNRRDK